MAIAFRSASSNTGSGQAQLAKPAGLAVGDLMLVCIETSLNLSGSSDTIVGPNGFALLAPLPADGQFGYFYWKFATADDLLTTNFFWSIGIGTGHGTPFTRSGMAAYSGVGSIGSITRSEDTNVIPAVAITDYGSMVVGMYAGGRGGMTAFTAPAGWTTRVNQVFSTLGAFIAERAFNPSTSTAGTVTADGAGAFGGDTIAVELRPPGLSASIVATGGNMPATLIKTGELGGTIAGVSELTVADLELTATFAAEITSASELEATMTGIPFLDFTVYDFYVDDGTETVGYIAYDGQGASQADQSLRLQPVRQDVGNNPAEIRPESGDLFAQSDFSHGAGQEYFHHVGRDPRKYLRSEGFDIADQGKLTHLHELALAQAAVDCAGVVVADGIPFVTDGTVLYAGNGQFPGIWLPEDWDDGETRDDITAMASSGSDLYIATAAGANDNGVHKRDAAGVWTHEWDDTNSLGFSALAWVKDRLMAVSGTAIYELITPGALPSPIETLAPGFEATRIFEAGAFIYVCWVNRDGGLTQVSHYGLNSGGTAIEKKGSTLLPQGQLATGGFGYLNTIFIGVGRENSDGGLDPMLYQGVADASGVVQYVKVVEEEGSGLHDYSVGPMAAYGEAIVLGWSLAAASNNGAPREGIAIYHLGLNAFAHHLATGDDTPNRVCGIALYQGRLLLAVENVGLYYEDIGTFVEQAEMVPSIADWSNAGLKQWDRLEVTHRPLPDDTSVTLDFTVTHPDEDDWDDAIVSNVEGSEGASSTLSTAISRLFDVRIRSNANTAQDEAPTVLGFLVRSNPKPADPEFQFTRTIRLFSEDRKDDKAKTLKQNPDDMRLHLMDLAYRWVKVYEPDTTWNARVETVATLEPQQPIERVTAGEPQRSGWIMQLVFSGTRSEL